MLASRYGCDPGLGQHHSVYSGPGGPWGHVDVVKIVEVSDDIACLHRCAAFENAFIMAVKRGYGKAGPVNHFELSLSACGVVGDRLDLAAELAK